MNTPSSHNPTPPKHLSAEAKRWWRAVVNEYLDLDPHHLKLLQAACEAWDEMQIARAVIAEQGQTFTDRFGAPKPRPEIAIARDNRIAFARLVRELGLDVAEPEESRPPKIGGRKHA